jgi:multisubunit Na+/H+ antiporter MnhB subunit
MFKFDKILSFVVLASLVGAVVSATAAILGRPGPGTEKFLQGMIACAGFLIALALAMGVIASNIRSRDDE